MVRSARKTWLSLAVLVPSLSLSSSSASSTPFKWPLRPLCTSAVTRTVATLASVASSVVFRLVTSLRAILAALMLKLALGVGGVVPKLASGGGGVVPKLASGGGGVVPRMGEGLSSLGTWGSPSSVLLGGGLKRRGQISWHHNLIIARAIMKRHKKILEQYL